MDIEKKNSKADLRFDSIEDFGKDFFLNDVSEPSKQDEAPSKKKGKKINNQDTNPLNINDPLNDVPSGNKTSSITSPDNIWNNDSQPLDSLFFENKVNLSSETSDSGNYKGSMGVFDSFGTRERERFLSDEERDSDKDLIKKLDNPAFEELLNLSGKACLEPIKAANPVKSPVTENTGKFSRKKNVIDKKLDTIEKLSTGELSYLGQKVENYNSSDQNSISQEISFDQVSLNDQEKSPEKKSEDEDTIETLSSNEISLLAKKFSNLSENELLDFEISENNMTIVETFDGLKINSVLPISPPPPELTDYKPNFVLSETVKVDESVSVIKEGKTFARKFDLYESGSFLGITVGKSTKVEVIKIMRDFGSEIFKPNETGKNDVQSGKSYFAKDLSLAVSFDENSIVNELTLGSEFKGQTSKGLRIGDPVKRIFELYGKADVVTPISFTWKDFVVFHKHDHVTHLRVQKRK